MKVSEWFHDADDYDFMTLRLGDDGLIEIAFVYETYRMESYLVTPTQAKEIAQELLRLSGNSKFEETKK